MLGDPKGVTRLKFVTYGGGVCPVWRSGNGASAIRMLVGLPLNQACPNRRRMAADR